MIIELCRLTRDPEQKNINGNSLVEFGVAWNQRNKDKTPVFIDCKCWQEKLNEIIISYLKKGSQVVIEGNLVMESWDSPEGRKINKHKILISGIQFAGTKTESGSQPELEDVF